MNTKTKLAIILNSAFLVLNSPLAMAGTVTSFAYQGVLRDERGKTLVQEQATITFRLYDAATDGNKLWEKLLSVAIDTNGLFNAELSGGNLASVIADCEEKGKALYIGLTVKDSAGEISPRQKMIATPLAAYAQNVAKADGDFTVAGTAKFNGAVTLSSSNSTFTACGSADVRGGLDVTGKAGLKGGAEVSSELKVSGGLTVDGVQFNLPIGAIIMWAGSKESIPDGWQLCDGSDWGGDTNKYVGTGSMKVPNLCDRFIVGAGSSYAVGATGGEASHMLSVNEMPSHTHSLSHRITDLNSRDGGTIVHAESSSTYSTGSAGGNQAHENRPPYYALCYIIKVR